MKKFENKMRKILFGITVLIVAASLGAQEAKVVVLKSEDANHARCAWERLQEAQKEWDEVQKDIESDYLVVPEGDKDASNWGSSNLGCTTSTSGTLWINGGCKDDGKLRYRRRGFESGFQFSSDFKYIVPKPYQAPTTNPCSWTWGGALINCSVTTPVTGTATPGGLLN